MTLVIDASVAVLWVLDQEGSGRAIAVGRENNLMAPSLIVAEIGSALWKAVRRGDAARADALIALDAALLPIDSLVPIEGLRGRALELASELKHPIYDCFYLALAERERAPLISADERLISVAKRMKSVEVRAL